ncbi:MAG: hypothetical protein OEW30_19835 [Acidimicrobiia bacterium]|nr:hypothetical protein [Acidimicrobiia bacterium]
MASPYHRQLLPEVLDDLRALADIDDQLVDAGTKSSQVVVLLDLRNTGGAGEPRKVHARRQQLAAHHLVAPILQQEHHRDSDGRWRVAAIEGLGPIEGFQE